MSGRGREWEYVEIVACPKSLCGNPYLENWVLMKSAVRVSAVKAKGSTKSEEIGQG